MTDYSKVKAGDVVETVYGRIKLSRDPQFNAAREWWTLPGYRWIKSRQQYSGTARLYNCQGDAPKGDAS